MKKILVAVDGSKPSLRAAEHAMGLARDTRARLAAVMVVDLPRSVHPDSSPAEWKELLATLRRRAQGTLDRVADMARQAKVGIDTEVLEGHVPTEIARYAEKEGFDLLVVGSRGLSAVPRLLLGSVSTALVHHSKVSVLVVK